MAVDVSPQGEFAQAVYQCLMMVPAGKVVTYGQLAGLAGHPRHARFVGRLMGNLPKGSKLPWWRVVRSDGIVTQGQRQMTLLQEEGVVITGARVNLKRSGFEP